MFVTRFRNPSHGEPFVGRRTELAVLRELSRRVVAGGARTAIVEGPPGIGSTSLVERFAEELVDFQIVRASAARSEEHTPYALAEHLAAMIETTSRSSQLHERSPNDRRDSTIEAVASTLLVRLEQLERSAPVLVLIDDAQWGDRESLAVLRFMLRRLGAERILTVLVGREGRGTWDELEARHDWPEHLRRVVVEGLDDSEVLALAAAYERPNIAPATLQRLRHVTDSNPLFLVAMLADHSASAEQFLAGRSPTAPSIADALAGLISSLSTGERVLLEALSVLVHDASAAQLTALTGSTDAETIADALVPTRIVRWSDSAGSRRLRFGNDLVRDAVTAQTTADRSKALHAAAASMTGPPECWGHLVASSSGVEPELLAQLESAADAELAERNYFTAARYLLWIHEMSEPSPTAARSLLRGVRTLVYGAHDTAVRQYRSAVQALPTSPERTETLGLLALSDGLVASARDLLSDARREVVERGDLDLLERIDLELAHTCGLLGLGEPTVTAAVEALTSVPAPRWPDIARGLVALGTAYRDGPLAGLNTLSWLPDQPSRCTPTQIPALAHRGMLRGLIGRVDEAIADLTVAARRRGGGGGLLGLHASVHLAWCQLVRGDWNAAQRTLDIAHASLEQAGRTVDRTSILSLTAILAASRGDREGAVSDLDAAADAAALCDHLGPAVQLALARATVARVDRDPSGVLDALRSVSSGTVGPERADLFAVWWLPMLADAQLDLGQVAAAQKSLTELRAVDADGPTTPIAVAWLEARVHDAVGRSEEARKAYERGVDIATTTADFGWYHAQLRAAFGRHLLEHGEIDAAVAQLRRASAAFQRFGARPDQADVDADLERALVGIESSAAWRRSLTDRELEIADLVGLGWTSREIATALYISAKTVEFHLRNTFSKLGISNRRQLRDLAHQFAGSALGAA